QPPGAGPHDRRGAAAGGARWGSGRPDRRVAGAPPDDLAPRAVRTAVRPGKVSERAHVFSRIAGCRAPGGGHTQLTEQTPLEPRAAHAQVKRHHASIDARMHAVYTSVDASKACSCDPVVAKEGIDRVRKELEAVRLLDTDDKGKVDTADNNNQSRSLLVLFSG